VLNKLTLGVDLQKKLIPLFHYALNSNGYLFLGTAETVGEYQNLFSLVDRKQKIYHRKNDLLESRNSSSSRLLPSMTSADREMPQVVESTVSSRKVPLRELTEQTLLQQTAPPAALVNSKGDILYLHGRTGLYLEPAPGESGVSNILKMAREGLRHDLTAGLHKAAISKEAVHIPKLRVKTNGDYTIVSLTIHPVASVSTHSAAVQSAAAPEQTLYLVILEKIPEDQRAAIASLPLEVGDKTDTDERILALKQELRAKEEYLQTTNEELETSNEELKSSNEEMQSVNL
jgi:two-component system, chemotaxis family, CheB/CheR fusion protein